MADPPGFAIDEPYEGLGRELKLPDQYEPMRAEIESRLPELQTPTSSANRKVRAGLSRREPLLK